MTDPASVTGDSTVAESSPHVQRLLTDARERIPLTLARRERRAELLVGGAFVVAAIALALLVTTDRPLEWDVAALCTLTLALASRVVFEVGSCYSMPTQVAFVPMLFLLPPELVPLFVVAGLALGKLSDAVGGELAPPRVAMALGDAWFAVGPALVFALADAPAPGDVAFLLYPAALAAQFLVESLASRARELLRGEASLREQLEESRWIYLVDVLLSPVGLVVAFAAVERTWTLALIAPLFLLLLIFARERLQGLQSLLELSAAYRGTAYVLGDMIGHDDTYTGLHTRGVVELALAVAEEISLDPKAKRNVEFGALLHDVGKVAVPNELINKPGPLTEAEWTIIRTHTVEGQRILEKIGGLMSSIGWVVRSSHERFDGAGYPDGLAGDQIPIESRVIFCCDAYNAMTTDRAYRKAMSIDEAIRELEDNAGTQFDPDIVAIVVRQVRVRHGLTA